MATEAASLLGDTTTGAASVGSSRSPLSRRMMSSVFVVAGMMAAVAMWSSIRTSPQEINLKASGPESGPVNSDTFEVIIDMEDFLAQPKVLEFIEAKGLHRNSKQSELEHYIPKYIVVSGKPHLIQGGGEYGALGAQAMDGYTAFAMQMKNTTGHYTAAYNIVLSMHGHIVSISPVMHHLGHEYHFISLKPYSHDPRFLIGGVDVAASQEGPVYLWNWDSTSDFEYRKLGGDEVFDCHDVTASTRSDTFWVTANDKGVKEINMTNGATVTKAMFDGHIVRDPNHAQLIERDSTVIISSRQRNAIVKGDISTEEVVWVCGGPNTTMDVVDISGKPAPWGTSLWNGQHNAEYFGSQEYFLFDDQSKVTWDMESEFQVSNESRYLIVNVDEDSNTAKITWQYKIGYWTPIFGDVDRVPTGNVLGASWVASFECPEGPKDCVPHDFDAEIIEVVRESKEVAWHAKVIGNEQIKWNNSWAGWSIYSAERIYTKPLVSKVSCKVNDNGIYVRFEAYDSIRMNNPSPGRVTFYDDNKVAKHSADITFDAYWRPAKLYVQVGKMHTCDGHMAVTNKWDQVTLVNLLH